MTTWTGSSAAFSEEPLQQSGADRSEPDPAGPQHLLQGARRASSAGIRSASCDVRIGGSRAAAGDLPHRLQPRGQGARRPGGEADGLHLSRSRAASSTSASCSPPGRPAARSACPRAPRRWSRCSARSRSSSATARSCWPARSRVLQGRPVRHVLPDAGRRAGRAVRRHPLDRPAAAAAKGDPIREEPARRPAPALG